MTAYARRRRTARPWLAAACLAAGTGAGAVEPLECVIEPYLLVEVSSSEAGVLGAVQVEEAQPVREGQVLAELETAVEQAALALARARAQAEGELELARRDHAFNARKRERTAELYQQRVVSTQDLDEVRTAEEVARLRMQAVNEKREQARLEVTRDELALARRIVRSPIDGVVVERYRTAGEYVDGDPIVQVAQLDPLRVELVAPIALYGGITVGMRAAVVPELAIEGEFVATVASIDPIVDAATATFGVRLSLPNPDGRLPPGLRCTLALESEEAVAAGPPSGDVAAPRPSVAAEPRPNDAAEPRPNDAAEPRPNAAAEPRPSDAAEPPSAPEPAPDPPARVARVAPSPPAVTQTEPEPASSPAEAISTPARAGSTPASSAAAGPAVASLAARPTTASAEAPGHQTAGSSMCASLGPIATEHELDAVARALSAARTPFERRYDSSGEPVWIVVTSEPTRSVAQLFARLDGASMSDYRQLRRGPWKDHVAFGTFRVQRWAQDRLHQVRSLGINAELRPKDGRADVWLDLHDTLSEPLPAALAGVLADHPKLDLQAVPCTQLASR